MIYVCGPGHGGPGMVANTYLEGTYSEFYPEHHRENAEGMKRLFTQFSFPGGIPSHVAPETPGSIHEGGELGYSLVHAYGAVFDNPGPAGLLRDRRWRGGNRRPGHELALQQIPQSRARRRGAADPAPERLQDRRTHRAGAHSPTRNSTRPAARATATSPISSKATIPSRCTRRWPARSSRVLAEIRAIQRGSPRRRDSPSAARWPMIVLRTPKGWTGPKVVDGQQIEGTFRAHQVPLCRTRHQARAHRASSNTG